MGSLATSNLTDKVVQTTLNYYLAPKDGGVDSYLTGSAASYRRKFEEHPAEIHDMRGREGEFTLDRQGFQLHQHKIDLGLFSNDEKIKQRVYPEIEDLLKKVTGATRVHIMSHLKRCDSPESVASLVSDPSLPDTSQTHKVIPARFVHLDHSSPGALTMFRDNVPASSQPRLLQSRWSITNVWRPLKPVRKDPLAICDGRTVSESDLHPITVTVPPKGSTPGGYDQTTKGDGFELLQLGWNAEQRWYYASGMTPEEVLLIKIFDTKGNAGLARGGPHSAFVDPEAEEGSEARESIEIRCLLFWEDQAA